MKKIRVRYNTKYATVLHYVDKEELELLKKDKNIKKLKIIRK